MKDLLVQKFGGTSIGTAERMLNVASIVKTTLAQGSPVAVVLSAMSSRVKNEGTTSMLLAAAAAALEKGPYYKIVDQLEERHFEAVEGSIRNQVVLSAVRDEVHQEFKKLKSFLDAIAVIGEISARSNDVIVSVGEKLAARIFAGVLNDQGVDAEYLNLEAVIAKGYREVNLDFCQDLQKTFAHLVQGCSGKVPVITGFFGPVPGGIIKSIGRGYTDFTAALVAAGCQAKELQIWKEVDGIFSADPNKVEKARVLPRITPEEAMELTYYGSEVIHPFTMEQVTRALVPVRIKNTFNPVLEGTLIDPRESVNGGHKPAAVTVKRGVTLLNIYSNRMLMAYGFMSKVFDVLSRHEIVIDLISTSEVNISMTLAQGQNIEQAMAELAGLGKVTLEADKAILSLVGRGMRHTAGMAGKMFACLGAKGINILAISQGASEINISCVIEDRQAIEALQAVHSLLEP